MENEKLLDALWDSDQPTLILVPDGGQYRLERQNPAADALCADAPSILDILLPEETAELQTALKEGAPASDSPLFCHAGREVFSAVIFGSSARRVCLLHKITSYYNDTQKALDEAILASRAKTSFLSEMSHDIRTPMGAIIGLTEIALSQPDTPLKTRECLGKIKIASGHMMSLLNEVLDISRIESGKILIQPEETSVADLLHEILIVAKPQADAGNLQFHLEMGQVVRERIMADSVRLKQICLNLISNAVKYTPAGGNVDLFFAIEPLEETDRVKLHLEVKDTGIGMSRDFLQRIFIPFEREQKSTVNKIQGTGLGMAITKNLVDLMHGDIQVESEVNKGSRFILEIPFEAAEEENSFLEALQGKRILLLDSDEKQTAQIRQMLCELGVAADCAGSAQAVVDFLNDAALAGNEYLAFLTVERIPEVEMMVFLPEIRQRMGSDFPILMLSESDWSQTEYMLTRAGVDSFIPLPLFKSRLADGLAACTSEGQGLHRQEDDALRLDFSHKRILLAEDNELNREIALELLGPSGAEIETAENGQEAVDRFQASTPYYYDMILMDIQMPVMNGLEASRTIRSLQRDDAQQVPILAMTANAFVEDVQNALDAGMDAHIAKPLDLDRLFSTMEFFLRRKEP